MKNNITLLRKEEQIKQALAKIITYEINNEDLVEPTVIDCKLSNDLSHLKVYVTFGTKSKKGLEALERAKGFIRTNLAHTLNWRKVPEIHFELDELISSGMKIDQILRDIEKEK
ncbi:30S ribosome-binding factor RbfA [Mycoplasma sp. 744]|uniref:30S ribosome-binding factor RbfA n=1 Tax=unclassified Mycoplasma TaxID=2683645 RepID=UPI00211CF9FE|nr:MULTISPECIES: 30S ribosome-binding factor RbfA [unclassified Mycoplasma]MEA4115372.1 30S ribosome-binding factor RbfA [Mycoplasma sp. 744]UUM19376.1 30S ribosome-binding factor RbfA [Mycoplasma sp. 1018B]